AAVQNGIILREFRPRIRRLDSLRYVARWLKQHSGRLHFPTLSRTRPEQQPISRSGRYSAQMIQRCLVNDLVSYGCGRGARIALQEPGSDAGYVRSRHRSSAECCGGGVAAIRRREYARTRRKDIDNAAEV